MELKTKYFHIGGVYEYLGDNLKVNPYLGLSLGLARLKPLGFDSENEFSLSISTGIKWMLNENIGLRFDARAIAIQFSEDKQFICSSSDGTCIVLIEGSSWWQSQLTAGLVFRLY